MSLRPESEFAPRSPSPASTDWTVDSMDDDQGRSYPTPSLVSEADPRHRPSLPPVRDLLNSVDSSFNARRTPSMRPNHHDQVNVAARAEAREHALIRALHAAHIRKQPTQLAAGPYAYSMGPLVPPAHVYHGDHDRRYHAKENAGPRRTASLGQPATPYHYTPHSGYNYGGLSPYTHIGHPRVVSLPNLGREQSIDSGYSSTRATSPTTDESDRPVPIESTESAPPIETKKRKAPRDFEDVDGEVQIIEGSKPIVDADIGKARQATLPKSDRVIAGRKPKQTKSASETSSGNSSSGDSDGQRESGKPAKKEFFNAEGVKLEVVEVKVDYDPDAYLKYVKPTEDGRWRCTWETMKNSQPASCDYPSKKHLVKRHIEATHMKIKRFMCTWCGKAFTQRSNVAGCHLNTHSGEAPHECDFCTDCFKDPSKRHKHMRKDHKYEPDKARKKFKTDNGTQRQSAHESITPWVAQPAQGTAQTTGN